MTYQSKIYSTILISDSKYVMFIDNLILPLSYFFLVQCNIVGNSTAKLSNYLKVLQIWFQ